MNPIKQPPTNVPFGTAPRRTAWPLFGLLVIFAAWFGFLLWLALTHPARH